MPPLSITTVVAASLSLSVIAQQAVHAQGVLVGCRLGATLQCVPGLTMTPQQQINVLKQEITTDKMVEGMIVQTIQGLERFELRGDAKVGSLLQTTLEFNPDDFAEVQVHWYKRNPGDVNWSLVGEVDAREYKLTQQDIDASVMAVVALKPYNKAIVRHNSNIIGPIVSQ